MHKITKTTFSILGGITLIILISPIILIILNFVRNGHMPSFEACKNYLWIFKDSVRQDVDPPNRYSVCGSLVSKRDINNAFHYFHENQFYPVLVWEFKDLGHLDLNKISINKNVNITNNMDSWSGETLDAKSGIAVTIKYGFNLKNSLNINLDEFSKIDGFFSGPNYKGFYGTINKMSFSNEKGEHQIIFDYTTESYQTSFSPSVFLLYKGHNSFYVIIVNSTKPFKDASIINIFNLE